MTNFMPLLNRSLIILLTAASLVGTSYVYALKEDDSAPVYVVAKSAELDRSTGRNTFRENVKIDQGSTHITGDSATTQNDATNRVEEVIIIGNSKKLAHYWSLPEINKPELHARALIIKFYPEKQYVILLGSASIIQGADSIKGARLEYDIKKQLLKSTHDPKSEEYTTIILEPKTDNKRGLADNNAGNKSK
jgi:lipopolysaccharide export system protein LptA